MRRIETLVLSGGGVKGIAYCGVFRYLKELQKKHKDVIVDIKEVIGVSVGSIFGLMYIIGYDYIEARNEILKKKMKDLTDSKVSNLIKDFGVDTGNNIIGWVETLMQKKNYDVSITMKEMYQKTGVHFKVITTNLTTQSEFLFDHVNTPDSRVIDILRMSMSIPFAFTVKKYNNDIHVDGALSANYPIHFSKDINSTLGFYFDTKKTMVKKQMGESESLISETTEITLNNYIQNVFKCVILSIDRERLEKYIHNTVFISFEGLGDTNLTLNFNLTKKQKMELITSGYSCVREFFENSYFCKNDTNPDSMEN